MSDEVVCQILRHYNTGSGFINGRAKLLAWHDEKNQLMNNGRLSNPKAYDSDPLDKELAEAGIEMTALHKSNRKKARTQDGRPLRRYKRRWKIERLFA